MKKINYFILSVFALGLMFVVSCGSSGTDGGSTDTGTFTLGSETLTTDTSESGGTKTTVVTDADGTEILTSVLTVNGVSLSFPGYDGTTDITFADTLSDMPTDYSANLFAAYVAGQLRSEGTMSLSSQDLSRAPCRDRDTPGCDWFPDTQCTLGCCADHDVCYSLNSCGASSWIPFVGSDACKNCNAVAAGCIELSCAGVIDTFTDDNCFDNRCGLRYDCDDGSCDCTSPCVDAVIACTSSSTYDCCGNGSCDVLEDADNCYSDCSTGEGTNTCCVATDDCPSELALSCPGDCCCCGLGEVCDQSGTDLCIASDREDGSFVTGTKTIRW